MSYRIEGLGWLPDAPDFRDHLLHQLPVQRTLERVLPAVSRGLTVRAAPSASVGALRVDLRRWCSPIEDQGNVGSCTAQAVVGALEYFERKSRGEHVDGSRLFLYRVTRRFLGWERRGDTGAFVRSTIKAARLFGVAPERYWRHDRQDWDAEPEAFQYAFAQNFKALEYFRIPAQSVRLRGVLDGGLPVAFGFTCYTSLFDPETTRTGVIPYPGPRDSMEGGHAVLAVGYTDSHVLIRNSWGTEWGDHGYGYLPWTYFDGPTPLASDCWVLVNAAWVPDDEADADVAPNRIVVPRLRARAAAVRPAAPPSREVPTIIRVSLGRDPIRERPLRLTSAGVEPTAPATRIDLPESPAPTSLYLKSLVLNESFDWSLFGNAVNELYVAAIAWDLSGAPPRVFPPTEFELPKGTYDVREGAEFRFVGDGLQLWPMKRFRGGLYVRIIVLESDDDVRDMGERLRLVRETVERHELTAALAALANPTAAAITAAGKAAAALLGVLGDILAANGDDLVAMFEGTYGTDGLLGSRTEVYDQNGARITLAVNQQL